MDIIVKCSNCNRGYKFKDTNKDLFSNKIDLNPKIHCKCGNVYVWIQAEHTFKWKMYTQACEKK